MTLAFWLITFIFAAIEAACFGVVHLRARGDKRCARAPRAAFGSQSSEELAGGLRPPAPPLGAAFGGVACL